MPASRLTARQRDFLLLSIHHFMACGFPERAFILASCLLHLEGENIATRLVAAAAAAAAGRHKEAVQALSKTDRSEDPQMVDLINYYIRFENTK